MELENSLKRLDEYLEKIGRSELVLGDQDGEAVDENPFGATAENDITKKSSAAYAIVEKSNVVDNIESPLFTKNEKSSTFTRDFTPSKHNSIDSYTESASVSVNENLLHYETHSYLEKESERMRESDFFKNVKTESLHLEESEAAVNELAEIGLSEENLQEFALSGNKSDETDFVSRVTPSVEVHPVSLKKSSKNNENPETVTAKQPPGQVTTLLDLSSIGELKRLWVKSDKVKKVNVQTSKRNDLPVTTKKLKSSVSASSHEEKMKLNMRISARSGMKRSSKELSDASDKLFYATSSFKERASDICTKPCFVKLRRVEDLPVNKNLKIDLNIQKNSTLVKFEQLDQTLVSGKYGRKVMNKRTENVKQNIKSSIANSAKKISAVSKDKKLSQNTKHKIQKLLLSEAAPVTAQKTESKTKKTVPPTTSSTDGNIAETEKAEVTEQSNDEPTVPHAEFDTGNDSEDGIDKKEKDDDDDYIPSDDEKDDDYHPKKKKKKNKAKRTYLSVRGKQGIVVKQENSNSTHELKVKASSKKVKGSRIGRPPVFGHFECKYCDFTANEKNLIDKHHFKTHRVVLKCEHCDKKFRTVNGLLEHNAYKHDGGKPFKCDFEGCPYASKNPLDLERHQAKHDPELKHVCDICGWRTRWRRNMRHHHILKHCDERNYKCTICEFAAKRKSDLKEHMYRHTDEKPIQCLTCGFRVKTNFELRSHMLVHSDVRPFKCTFPGCSSATKTKSDLTKHMRVHQTERPLKCHICFKGYKDQTALNKHLTGIHVTERKFKCDICGKTFKNRYALKKHVFIHSGFRPYECPVCKWKFTTRSNMESHMVTHDTTSRPFLCPLCPYAAKIPDHLLAHIGSYHGDKYAYFCEFCKKPFKRYMQLKLHYERMHTKKEVESLKNSPNVDLALLKMEMKLELEEAGAGHKKRKSRSRRKTSNGTDIKEEPVDEEYGDAGKYFDDEEDVDDVRLNENTGEIEVVKKKKLILEKQDVRQSSHAYIERSVNFLNKANVEKPEYIEDEIESGKNEDKELLTSDTSEIKEGNKFVESKDVEENAMIERNLNKDKNVRQENMTDIENDEGKKESILIAKDDLSTVALYDSFRLPLATRGFQFNYDKTGKKPAKAWFMDVSLMDGETAERHKKHSRRVGLLPPIPRGHPPKGYKKLKGFVDKRKKQLAENIKKAKFVKDLGLVSKRNASRSKRFKGKYTEFETIGGEVLSIAQVQERLPELKNLRTENVIKQTKNRSSDIKTKKNQKKAKTKTFHSRKLNCLEGTSEIGKNKRGKKINCKKKKASKTVSRKSPKLLLSTEKRNQKKPKLTKLNIRRPKFLEKTSETSKTNAHERNSFEALESILTELNSENSTNPESENIHDGTNAERQKTGKKEISKAKTKTIPKLKIKNTKKSKEKIEFKPKYNKKYVPVKQPIKQKNNDAETPAKNLKLADIVSDLNKVSRNKSLVTKLSNSRQNCERTKQSKEKVYGDISKSIANKYHVQENQGIEVYPASMHVPVQNTQLVMVYPVSTLQVAGVSQSGEIAGHSGVFVAVDDNYSAVTEGTAVTERIEFKRDLNDALTDSFGERAMENNVKTIIEKSDKEIMQQEYTETVMIKEEPGLTFYTDIAQHSTTV